MPRRAAERKPGEGMAKQDQRPAGYPVGCETELTLGDGRTVFIRPIVPSDSAELAEAIRTADADTLHTRFLGATPTVTDGLLRALTCLDYRTRFALAAFAPDGRGVAVARYVADAPQTSAEVAVAVDPQWRRVGLATALVRLLAERAQSMGIGTFTAFFTAVNRPVTELASHSGARVSISQGVAELSAQLTEAQGRAAMGPHG